MEGCITVERISFDMSGLHKLETGHHAVPAESVRQHPRQAPLDEARLLETQRAFDSVAADYDGPRGNNELIQRMRTTMWDAVHSEMQPGARLLRSEGRRGGKECVSTCKSRGGR